MTKKYPPPFEREGASLFTGVSSEKVARYVILTVRDPLHGYVKDAAEEIAEHLDCYEKVADTRMFTTFTGKYKGVSISVCSTGSGAPEAELALMDFIRFTSADTFVRVGTSGALQEWIKLGELIISSAAVRDEGTSKEYVKPTYPAVASYEVVLALASAAEKLGVNYHIGITRSNDAIYVGEGRPICNYLQEEHVVIPRYWARANVLNVEREAALILTLCNIFGKRGGAICTIVDNELTGEVGVGVGKEESIKVALEAFKFLAEWDRRKEETGKKYLVANIIGGRE